MQNSFGGSAIIHNLYLQELSRQNTSLDVLYRIEHLNPINPGFRVSSNKRIPNLEKEEVGLVKAMMFYSNINIGSKVQHRI